MTRPSVQERLLAGVRGFLEGPSKFGVLTSAIAVEGSWGLPDGRAVWTGLREVQDYASERLGISLKVGRVDEDAEVDAWKAWETHTELVYPTLVLVGDARLRENVLGIAVGEFALVAYEHELWQFTAVHELGHLLGLRHEAGTFMDPVIENGVTLPVTPAQRQIVQRYARHYGLEA